MGNDVAIREHAPAMVRLSSEQLQYIAHTEFVPKSMRGNLPAILACVAYGRELGLGDMVALRNIHMIDGRPALSAEVMVGMVRDRGHSIQGNFSGDSCTVTGKRADNGDEMSVTWTREMAKDAGLANKDNHKKYPAAMLWARGVSQLCRMLFADCFAGSTHTPEEIQAGEWTDEIEDSAGEPEATATTTAAVSQAVLGEPASPADTPAATAAQIKKLNVLVGTLREAGAVTTEEVWAQVRPEQSDLWPGDWPRDDDGELHWSPLRDSLSKQEASHLIEWLTAIELGQGAAGGSTAPPAAPSPSQDVEPLSIEQLREWIVESGVSKAAIAAVGKRLFPGQSAERLTDLERGLIRVELEGELAGV